MSPNDYSISAPALHAARAVMQHFILEPIEDVKASEKNIATLIDVHTKSWRAKRAMKDFFSHLRWLGDRELETNIPLLRERINTLQQFHRTMPQYEESARELLFERTGIEDQTSTGAIKQIGREAIEYRVSAPALHATRILMSKFKFSQRHPGVPRQLPLTERAVAVLIDLCTQMWIVQSAMSKLCAEIPWSDPREIQRLKQRIHDAMYLLSVAQNIITSYSTRRGGSSWRTQHVSYVPTSRDIEHASMIASRLAAASTPEEEHRILQQSSILR